MREIGIWGRFAHETGLFQKYCKLKKAHKAIIGGSISYPVPRILHCPEPWLPITRDTHFRVPKTCCIRWYTNSIIMVDKSGDRHSSHYGKSTRKRAKRFEQLPCLDLPTEISFDDVFSTLDQRTAAKSQMPKDGTVAGANETSNEP